MANLTTILSVILGGFIGAVVGFAVLPEILTSIDAINARDNSDYTAFDIVLDILPVTILVGFMGLGYVFSKAFNRSR